MTDASNHLGFLRPLGWHDILLLAVILITCSILVLAVRRIVHRVAGRADPQHRLLILRVAPIIRLLISIAGISLVVPILVEPNFEDVSALTAPGTSPGRRHSPAWDGGRPRAGGRGW